MAESPGYPGSIVVGADGSDTSKAAVDWAAARASAQGRTLVVLLAVPEGPAREWASALSGVGAEDDFAADVGRRAGDRIAAEADRVRAAFPGLTVETAVVTGEASRALARATRSAALVVVGARGWSAPMRTHALGGTSDAIATHAHGPVAVVPEVGDAGASGPVVVGVDNSPESMEAIKVAVAEAVAAGVPLVAVHTWSAVPWLADLAGWSVDESTSGANVDRMVHDLVEAHAGAYPDLAVEYVVRSGDPATALVQESHRASLVVVGSRGRGGFAGLLLGSTSRDVMRGAHCPVIVVRAEDVAST